MAAKPIFTAPDDAFLMQRNLLKPALHRRRLVSSSISQSVSLSSSDSGLSEDSGVDTKDFTMIPEFLESEETIEWLGWNPTKAAEIWNKWKVIQETEQEQGTIFEVDFLQQALGHIPRRNFEDSSSDWEEHMRCWGISDELIDAIMDVEFTDVRCTKSAQHWVTDTIEIRYLSLERIRRESDQRTRNNHVFNPSIASTGVPRYSTVPSLQILFKAISTERLGYKGGKIHVGSLVSKAATDFRGYGAALYFTPDYQVADRYRQYIRRRVNTSPALIIQLALPNAWIEGLPPRVLEFGDLWKKVVHTCRQGYNMTGEMKFIHNLPLIVAPIAHSPNKAIARLDTWQEVNIQHVMKVEGQETPPVQYVFQGDDNLEEIGQVGELKMVT
ncbi:uncharacterized protein Bfra_002109 [Botrytis fragariae]|uniref:Uncharacterized protein n=1 Tax=Botrytis fragariae TaxID=1964551 RepID=A0A8H6EMF9_9HELO|nr:uncharacterized protein Bfra_002109 [Botrytis fragariae]KAF5877741.1 hypothetical protein Bfra_002109 [Botrytis fragariae]